VSQRVPAVKFNAPGAKPTLQMPNSHFFARSVSASRSRTCRSRLRPRRVYNVLSSVTYIRICSNPNIAFVCTVHCRIQSINYAFLQCSTLS